MAAFNPLLDIPAYPATGYAKLADRMAALLGTANDVLIVQGEAIIALEAAALSLARPGLRAVNVVTSLYGGWFGDWLRRGGAEVIDVVAEPGLPVEAAAVAAALDSAGTVGLVSLVHAESATGILNPLPEIAALAKAREALLLVDAVASAGGHTLEVDRLGIDICVTGPQKALGGSSGLSIASISRAAWQQISLRGGPQTSTLSLIDLKRLWLDTGRGMLPGMPSALEFHALEAALDRFEAEGLALAVARHGVAAEASRRGVSAMGLRNWADPARASNLVTAAELPEGIDAVQVAGSADPQAGLSPGVGTVGPRLIRLNHTGPRAARAMVLQGLSALADALTGLGHAVNRTAALDAANAVYEERR